MNLVRNIAHSRSQRKPGEEVGNAGGRHASTGWIVAQMENSRFNIDYVSTEDKHVDRECLTRVLVQRSIILLHSCSHQPATKYMMASSSTARHPRRIAGRVDWICVDLGTGGLRMGCSNEGDEDCKEIANYAEAQAGTPSLVPQAPSDIIYEPNDEGPAEPVAFGYARPRKSRRQTVVSKVKIALLPDPESYGYAHSLLVHASDTLRLSSVQQIPEDFLRFAVAHATKECGGQPRKGWVFSVPQSYGIEEVRNFRALIKKAGGIGNIYIHGESDCVTYANLPSIQDIIGEARELAFKQGRNFSVTAGIFDLGAGTAVRSPLRMRWIRLTYCNQDVTTSEICFNVDGTPPTITERRAPLGTPICSRLHIQY